MAGQRGPARGLDGTAEAATCWAGLGAEGRAALPLGAMGELRLNSV